MFYLPLLSSSSHEWNISLVPSTVYLFTLQNTFSCLSSSLARPSFWFDFQETKHTHTHTRNRIHRGDENWTFRHEEASYALLSCKQSVQHTLSPGSIYSMSLASTRLALEYSGKHNFISFRALIIPSQSFHSTRGESSRKKESYKMSNKSYSVSCTHKDAPKTVRSISLGGHGVHDTHHSSLVCVCDCILV